MRTVVSRNPPLLDPKPFMHNHIAIFHIHIFSNVQTRNNSTACMRVGMLYVKTAQLQNSHENQSSHA